MTADQPRAKRRSRKWWLVGAGVVVVIGLAAIGWSAWVTHSYESDFQRWAKHDKPRLLANTSFSPLTAVGYPGEVYTEDRQAQKAGCADVASTRKKKEAAAAALPAIDDWPLLPRLNPAYGRAQDRDDERHRLVNSYRAEADQLLAAMQRDCAFDSAYLAAMQRYRGLTNDADQLLDPKGPSGDGWVCDYKEGCIPSNPTKKKSYQRAMTEVTRHERSQVLSLYQAKRCERTSLADACAKIAAEYDAGLDADRAYNRLIVGGSTSAIDAAIARADRTWKRFERRSAKILESQHPGVQSITTFRDDPTDTDAFFAGVAQLEIRDLLKRWASIDDKLS